MAREIFDFGDVVRAKNTYTNPADGQLVDPSVVQVEVRSPDGTKVTYIYLTDAELTRLSLGVYQVLIPMAQTGSYRWYWTGTATDGNTVDYDECDSERRF